MAYNNEFPHFEANKLNLNWLLEQYSTFNDRIQEIMTAFNTAVEQFESDLQDFETDVNTAISNFETNVNNIISEFQTTINDEISEFQTSTNDEISEFETTVTNEINSLTTNMITYVSEHMDEWQAEASYSNNTLKLSNEASPSLSDEVINKVQLDGYIHNIGLEVTSDVYQGSTNWDDTNMQFTNAERTITPGTYLFLITQRLSNDTYSDNEYNRLFNIQVVEQNADAFNPKWVTTPENNTVNYYRKFTTSTGNVSPNAQGYVIGTCSSTCNVNFPFNSIGNGTPILKVTQIKLS